MRFSVVGVAIAMCAVPATVQAQHSQVRSGLWMTGGLGNGRYTCGDCSARESGLTATVSLGGTLSQRVLLGGGYNVWSKRIDGRDVTASTLIALVRLYPSTTSGFHFVGGIGYGHEAVIEGGVRLSKAGKGVLFGLGKDVRVGRNVSVTPFWHVNGIAIHSPGIRGFAQLGVSVTRH